jgi:hypothetical protein
LVAPKYSLHAELKAFMDGQISKPEDYSAHEPPVEHVLELLSSVDDHLANARWEAGGTARKRLRKACELLRAPPPPGLSDQERHALWNAVEAARSGFAWTDPTGRKLLADLYERSAPTKGEG